MKTVQDMLDFYFTTEEFKRLSDSSKHTYRYYTSRPVYFLSRDISEFDKPYTLLRFKKQWDRTHTKHGTSLTLRIFSRIWNVALLYGYVDSNPFVGIPKQINNRRTVRWTPEEIATIRNTAIELGYPSFSLLVHLCYELCQRPGDMYRMKIQQVQDGRVHIKQQKTGVDVSIKLSDDLLEHIYSRRPYTDYVLNYERTKVQYTIKVSANIFRKIKDIHPEYKHLQLRDLRRTGLTELGEAGCTEAEIMAVSGHKTPEMVAHYVIKSPTIADNAVTKRNELYAKRNA